MVQHPYDPGLKKSRFENDQVDVPLVATPQFIEKDPQLYDSRISQNPDIENKFNIIFFDELKKAATMMQSLYSAVFPLDPEAADKLLQQAFQDLVTSIRSIAADFSLGMYKSLSKKSKPIKKSIPNSTETILDNTNLDITLKQDPSIPQENLDDISFVTPQKYKKELRSTRSNPII